MNLGRAFAWAVFGGLAACGGGGAPSTATDAASGPGRAPAAAGASSPVSAAASAPARVPTPAPAPAPASPPADGASATTAADKDIVPIPAPRPDGLVMAAAVPQPAGAGDVVGVVVQNTAATDSGPAWASFGQVFRQGAVRPSDSLATTRGARVQMDPQALWPDGSVRFAVLTLAVDLPARSQLPVMLGRSPQPSRGDAVGLADALDGVDGLKATLAFRSGQYAGERVVDLGGALKQSLAGSPDHWLRGPLATQARVDVPLPGGPMHVAADVTAFADGNVCADVQFDNDVTSLVRATPYANPGPLPPQVYDVALALGGRRQDFAGITQHQFQDWHAVICARPVPALNVQHDLAYLERAGAVLPFDGASGVAESLLQGYQSHIAGAAGFGAPLAANGVTPYMPMTGGRTDIGYATQSGAVWLMTQDARAATVALAQGDAGGAVPWNYRLANGHWLTRSPSDGALGVWVDGRASSTTIANQAPHDTPWTPDTAHQPDLAYVPYLMTGRRWYLDRLNAQAAFGITAETPVTACTGDSPFDASCDIVLNAQQQVRAQAWSMREIQEAAFIGRAGSWEQAYFEAAVAHNWSFARFIAENTWTDAWNHRKHPPLSQAQGAVRGWYPGLYGSGFYTQAEWQQDYLTGVAALGAAMGHPGARQYVDWQRAGWLSGRFTGAGMNPFDGCNYNLVVGDAVAQLDYTSWSQVEAATAAAGLSQGHAWIAGDYCQLARAALGAAASVFPDDAGLRRALAEVNAAGDPMVGQKTFATDPQFNIVPLR